MPSSIVVRAATVNDAPGLARVHVDSWRETYRGQMSDSTLDDPDFYARREQFWMTILTDSAYQANVVAAAELAGRVVGVAMSGPAQDADASWARELSVLYTYAAVHGRGAGSGLLALVLDPTESASLWVSDPNPRAQAFYRKHGFEFDGAQRDHDGARALRVLRSPSH